MAVSAKQWSRLGLITVLAGSTSLAGCGQQEPLEENQSSAAALQELGAQPVAVVQGGEGEGGVAIEAAAYDRAVYLTAIAIAKAHVLAARDAFAAGETEAAGEMFAHPAAEVLFDMKPIFEGRGVTPFEDMFLDASDAVFDGAPVADVRARTAAILNKLDEAATSAPPSDKSAGQIAVAVVADQIDRAADMYKIAKDVGSYGPYLDGYGFYEAAKLEYEAAKADIAAARPDLIGVIDETLAALAKTYPAAAMPDVLPLEPAALLAQASKLKLALS